MGLRVRLTDAEVLFAATVGIQRHALSLERGDTYGFDGDGWGVDIEGAGAEFAYAKARNKPWTPVVYNGRFQDLAGDVGAAQIRSTQHLGGCLLLHREDPDEAPFALVVGKLPTYTVVGYIYGRDGKQDRFWRDCGNGRPAFFVPQDALKAFPERA